MKTLLLFLISFSAYGFNKAVYDADQRSKIAILDTGASVYNFPHFKPYLCKGHPHADFTEDNNPFRDDHLHGTNITGLIIEGLNPEVFCVIIVKLYNVKWVRLGHTPELLKKYRKAIKYISDLDPHWINMSLSGRGQTFGEKKIFRQYFEKGIPVFTSAGNKGLDLDAKCDEYPACFGLDFHNIFVIGILPTGLRAIGNYGKVVDKYVDLRGSVGSPPLFGTSQASALVVNHMLQQYEKNYGTSR